MHPDQRRPVTPRSRNAFQGMTAAVTGAATFGALTATGLIAGELANTYEAEKAEKAAQAADAQQAAEVTPVAQVVEKRRPYRTVVRTKVVQRVSAGAATSVGPGGSLTVRPSSGSAGQPARPTGGGGGGAPAPAPAPAPPPPPAPSSGS